MPNTKYTYMSVGPNSTDIANQIDPSTTVVSTGPVWPPSYVDVVLSDNTQKAALDVFMSGRGYQYFETDGPAESSVSLISSSGQRLTTTGTTINSGNWTTITDGTNTLSASVSSYGGSRLIIATSLRAGIVVGGRMRILVNGGAYTNYEAFESFDLPILADWRQSWSTFVLLPSNSSRITYTVTVQMQNVGLVSSILLLLVVFFQSLNTDKEQ